MTHTFGLNDNILNMIFDIVQKYKYDFYVFGSRARGNYRDNSDIDIAIDGYAEKNEQDKIRNDFDSLNIPYMIDLLFISELKNDELIENIRKEGVLIGKES